MTTGVAVQKRHMLYEGKAKQVFATDNPELVIFYFKDDATAFNAKKRGSIEGKGVINNRVSELFFTLLEKAGVRTHFVKRLSEREMLCRKLEIIPVEAVVRNIVAGSMAKRLGRAEGEVLPRPVVEWYYKSDPLDDPLINDDHAQVFGWASAEELAKMRALTLKINDTLRAYLDSRGITLVDAKFEFGRFNGDILVGDEICPDTCRFWDKATGEKLDKDRFRRDLGGVEDAYQEVLKRVEQ